MFPFRTVAGGANTGATPDGRYAGEVLADGSTSPMRGRDKNGPIAVLNSAAKIDQSTWEATLLNMKFHPSALKTDEDLFKLDNMIRTYFTNGGKHVQFNVVDNKTLLDAQEHPENYPDLIVRVAGYSAYFTAVSAVAYRMRSSRERKRHISGKFEIAALNGNLKSVSAIGEKGCDY